MSNNSETVRRARELAQEMQRAVKQANEAIIHGTPGVLDRFLEDWELTEGEEEK